ncbi:WD40-repeat-containing domain protein [Halteromyces radiatus]|uniref:WD40-repeat-containing domain protein n=1 Tax=Halteromyces radiatus TaxID=101107 RepID=UPI00221F62A9|nr:WD40-repeat-containing domain protein [Halteromyces radiatus]KAI8092762.1 WD40-repeat-containing domain protein [Halteromyces radiatus]
MNPSPSSHPTTVSNPNVNIMPAELVVSYLKKEGYTATESVFLKELNGIPVELPNDSSNGRITNESETETTRAALEKSEDNDDPVTYDISYKSLREWIENSLDWYKPELRSVLFPIFVHAYLDLIQKRQIDQAKELFTTYQSDHIEVHTPDLKRLESIKEPQHVRENELAQIYRNNKYNLRMSSVPFELFLSYLQDNRFMLLLRIVNQYINIQVVHGKLLKSAGGLELDDVIGITGHQSQHLETFNQQPVQLGQLPMDPAFKEEMEQALKDEEQISKDETSENPDTTTNSLLELFKKVTQDQGVNSPALNDIPLPPYRGTDIQAEINLLKDIQKRLPLGHDSLPSICCYTFHNTYDTLNCLSVTKDASLVAGGFSDSFVKIWSLKGEKLKGFRNTINPAYINDYDDLNRQKERHGSEFKKLVGHSNSVYGVSFSPDDKYLLSCSADKTTRLWSTQTYTNLVIYKGHNYPIWDVDFGPFGFYFATASHDRTARLWSCDQIYPLRVFAGHLSDVDVVKFHPNSKYVVTGSSDRTARMWDIQTGKTVRVFTGHRGAIKTVALSPNGQLMASAGDDHTIMLWDLGTGRRLKTMTGHTDIIYSLRFSMDNNVLVSGGADDTVRVWDVNQVNTDISESKMESKRIRLDSSSSLTRQIGKERKITESKDHLGVFPTKHTPIYDIQFTNRNLCLVAGAFKPPL